MDDIKSAVSRKLAKNISSIRHGDYLSLRACVLIHWITMRYDGSTHLYKTNNRAWRVLQCIYRADRPMQSAFTWDNISVNAQHGPDLACDAVSRNAPFIQKMPCFHFIPRYFGPALIRPSP
jgi:hypothetical protein